MNEAGTRELIDPALKVAGWGVVEGSRVRREEITKGRLEGRGRRARGEAADYVLYDKSQTLARIEERPSPRSGRAKSMDKGKFEAEAAGSSHRRAQDDVDVIA